MKLIYIVIVLLSAFAGNAQNVGINTNTPSEKLDVNGNINVSGTIKANGVAGTNGQVLMSTASGLTWGSTMNYKNCVMLTTPGSSTWTVPAGVTEIMVEAWGGGSGGTSNCGGTSGGYARSVQPVTPGYGLAYVVGSGSLYGSTTSADGGFSQVTFPFGFMRALGGGGVSGIQFGTPKSGISATTINAYFLAGNTGGVNIHTYGQKSSTIFVEQIKYGNGGIPVGLMSFYESQGDIRRFENSTLIYYVNGTHSVQASAGGAAGASIGWNGANGMVVIWYN